ncbi:MAG: endonuclease/exonuclease/phosphatase family protein [Candidatus Pseudobacter hemicellulosilyticus]|uniref:Endonuclease/exonuclease/phosphatase family protein n=1 Tax=Candidatus Pseudobacter hemicellulosilyticus TaxID=3121375 RepID=A0AAJ6BIE8_9BACT|nr:MAG: endonuclease/exonuclease/phosphatase family protein [Pseudobacter sp.]
MALTLFSGTLHAQSVRVASYNLRYANQHDTGNLWQDRLPIISALIGFHDFDIFGTQEGYRHQLDSLSAHLPGYSWYGVGRDDGQSKGEHSAVFFKKDKFKLLAKGDFWLSETPEKPGFGWDAKHNRICSWVQLQDLASKKKFYFFSVHFDHQGVVARVQSSKLILRKIKEIAGSSPAILAGDFNGGHDSEWYLALANNGELQDTYKLVAHPYALGGSFNDFGRNIDSKEIIDHIFVSKGIKAKRWGLLTDTYQGKYPSDHCPVMADLDLR